jgi:hypothetical protein
MSDIQEKPVRQVNNDLLKKWAEVRGDRYVEDGDGIGRLKIPADPADKE